MPQKEPKCRAQNKAQRQRKAGLYTWQVRKGQSKRRRGWEEKATERSLRLQRQAPFVAEFSCDGRLMFREGVKESINALP